jgi:uncharacterized protein (TIGR04255 family)
VCQQLSVATMADRPSHLADYRDPPVDEVVVALQFPPIPDLTDIRIREFWKTVRDEYPIAEHQPRLEGPIESAAPSQPVTLEFPTSPPQGRLWMISEADDFLLQVQNTRFIQNWRRRQLPYNHFEELRERFWRNFKKFRDFLVEQSIAAPITQQIEITYLNWIPEIPMVDFLLPASGSIINVDGTTRAPEDQTWTAKYLLSDSDGIIVRLYVQCLPAIRPQSPGVRGSQLGLIFRAARKSGLTDEEIAGFIDSGRVTIVETFAQITTSTVQEAWGRYK